MINFEKKKIAISLLLVSVVLIIFITILKERLMVPIEINPDGSVVSYREENAFELFGIVLSYNNSLFTLIISVIFSILALIFLDDDTFKIRSKKLWNSLTISNLSKHFVKTILIIMTMVIFILILLEKCNNNKTTVSPETYEDKAIDSTTAEAPAAEAPINYSR